MTAGCVVTILFAFGKTKMNVPYLVPFLLRKILSLIFDIC